MKSGLIAVIACSLVYGQTTSDLLKDARIALRLNSGQVLIVGGELRNPKNLTSLYDRSMESLPRVDGHSPFQPIEEILRVPPGYLSRFRIDPEMSWRPGDHWKVYSGAGLPVEIVIESLSFGYYCGGIGGYAAAIARIQNPHLSEVITGLRSGEYLAAPVKGLDAVSESPLVPVDLLHESKEVGKIEKILLESSRKIVDSDSWKAKEAAEARQIDTAFLNTRDLRCDSRVLRWRVPGRKPLLFVESVWTDAQGKLFGGNAVIEEGNELAVLNFNSKEGELMRVVETLRAGGWTRPEGGIFLNAWVVGVRRFVLIHTQGYEGFSIDLMEIVPAKGLVDTGIHFGAGC